MLPKWLNHLPFISKIAVRFSVGCSQCLEPTPHIKLKSNTSTLSESRGLSLGTPVSYHRESWQGGLGMIMTVIGICLCNHTSLVVMLSKALKKTSKQQQDSSVLTEIFTQNVSNLSDKYIRKVKFSKALNYPRNVFHT